MFNSSSSLSCNSIMNFDSFNLLIKFLSISFVIFLFLFLSFNISFISFSVSFKKLKFLINNFTSLLVNLISSFASLIIFSKTSSDSILCSLYLLLKFLFFVILGKLLYFPSHSCALVYLSFKSEDNFSSISNGSTLISLLSDSNSLNSTTLSEIFFTLFIQASPCSMIFFKL